MLANQSVLDSHGRKNDNDSKKCPRTVHCPTFFNRTKQNDLVILVVNDVNDDRIIYLLVD